jgi:predicted GIY-YIG superfamily endonuclease
MNDETALYRCFDEDGKLLYVGISMSALNRLQQHKDTSIWFENARRIEVEYYRSREYALKAEKEAIKTEKPRFNKIHNVSSREVSEFRLFHIKSPPQMTKIEKNIDSGSQYNFPKTWPWKKKDTVEKPNNATFSVITEFNTLIDANIFLINNRIPNNRIKLNPNSGKYELIEYRIEEQKSDFMALYRVQDNS